MKKFQKHITTDTKQQKLANGSKIYMKIERGEGELDESNQNVQTFSYKINKYQGYKVQHDKYN